MHIETNHVRATCLLQCWSGLAQAAVCLSVPALSYGVGLEFSMGVSTALSTLLSSRISLSFSSSKSRVFKILPGPIFSQQYTPSSSSLLLWQRRRAGQAFTVPAVWGLIGQAPNITNHKNRVVDIPQKEGAAVSLWGVTAGLCSYSLH